MPSSVNLGVCAISENERALLSKQVAQTRNTACFQLALAHNAFRADIWVAVLVGRLKTPTQTGVDCPITNNPWTHPSAGGQPGI
jgi:hypothetical protein